MTSRASYFDFHSSLETPGAFLRREWRWVALCSALLTGVLLAAVLSVDPAYYYPRMITDQLLYYMKGLSLVRHGTTEVAAAVNVEPFDYASAPGILRAPWMMLYDDFDDQLRAIQLSNIVQAVLLGTIFAYVFSWVLPQRAHPAAIAFSFATLLLNPVWVTNVLSPLADLPYAVTSLGCVVLLTRLTCGSDEERRSRGLSLLSVILFVTAFALRFTAPVLFVYGWLLLRGQPARKGPTVSMPRRTFAVLGVCLAVLLLVNSRTIVFGYLWQPWRFLLHADKADLILNTLALAVPAQLIPGFDLLFVHPPVVRRYDLAVGGTPFDFALLGAGLLVAAVVMVGVWVGRHKLLPEIAHVLLPLPVLAALMPSTARYLHSYQPFFWMFIYLGGAAILRRAMPGLRWRRPLVLTAGAIACVFLGAELYLRANRLSPGGTVQLSNFSLGETRRHAPEVARTFRALRDFLERLPHDRSLVVNHNRGTGQWKVIAGVNHYRLDSGIVAAAARYDLYLVVDCATKRFCSDFEAVITRARERVKRFAEFEYDPVFATANTYSAARVYRLRPVP